MLAFLRRNRPAVAVALIVVGVAGAIFVTVAMSGGGGSGSKRAAAPTSTGSTRPLTAAAREMLSLLEEGRQASYDARLDVSGPTKSTVHILRAPPMARVETDTGPADQVSRSLVLSSAIGPLRCTQKAGEAWTCERRPGQEDPGLVPSSLASRLATSEVVARNDRVNDIDVRCFTIGQGGTTAEVCLTRDGIPVRLALGPININLVELNRVRPPDSAFAPPAPPKG